jgi:hypothetical protein
MVNLGRLKVSEPSSPRETVRSQAIRSQQAQELPFDGPHPLMNRRTANTRNDRRDVEIVLRRSPLLE